MQKLHQKAMEASEAYRDWHKHELSELLSWAIFFAMAFMAYNVVTFESNRTIAAEYAVSQSPSPTMHAASTSWMR